MSKVVKNFVASLAALGLVATMSLAPVSAAEMVPHKANAAGNFAFIDNFHLQLDGTGNAAHLGKVTSSGVISFLGFPDEDGCIPLHDNQTLTSVDTGEQLTIEVNGEACPTTGPAQPFATGVYEIDADFAITGGTGRFAGASGGGRALCFGNFDNQTFSFTQVGTVSRPDED